MEIEEFIQLSNRIKRFQITMTFYNKPKIDFHQAKSHTKTTTYLNRNIDRIT